MLNTTDVRRTAKLPSAALPVGSWQLAVASPASPAPCSKLFALPTRACFRHYCTAVAHSVFSLIELCGGLANRNTMAEQHRRVTLLKH